MTKSSELMMALLKGGANPNMADKDGNAPLQLCESPALMAALLQAGADPNVTNQVTCHT